MQTTLFPHDTVRAEQDKLIDAVLRTIDNKGQLVVHAPTGLGKTAATLAPAIERAITENKLVIFMTSRLTQHQLAIDTIKKIRAKHNVKISVVDLIGKKNFCMQPGVEKLHNREFSEYCKAMREDGLCEYYTRLKQGDNPSPLATAIITKLGKQAIHTPQEVKETCQEAKLCPYEITISLAKDTRVLICDYSYLFNESIRENLFGRIGKELSSCILIIDEGHNLAERVKDQASEKISNLTIRRAIGELEKNGKEDRMHHLERIFELLNGMGKQITDERYITRSEFLESLASITDIDTLIEDLEHVATAIREEQKSSSCGTIADFLEAWKQDSKGFTRIVSLQNDREQKLDRIENQDSPTNIGEQDSKQNAFMNASSNANANDNAKSNDYSKTNDYSKDSMKKESSVQRSLFGETIIAPQGYSREAGQSGQNNQVQLSYRCLDSSVVTKPVFDQVYATILMSGTLTPPIMYAQILGLDSAELLLLQSPFPAENRLNIIIPKTTTKFTSRNTSMYNEIATICSQCADAAAGNVAIFFPSYHLLNEMKNTFSSLTTKTVFTEHPSFTKEEREALLERFKMYKHDGAVLLGVMGGSFSEGIDLPGDQLRAVIVVGLPLSKPNLETKALIDYYQEKFGKGWEYGYTYPAFNKTLQSAGRCIRTETDRGAIIFLDERYAWQNYYDCFPKDWRIKISLLYEKMIRDFFVEEHKL